MSWLAEQTKASALARLGDAAGRAAGRVVERLDQPGEQRDAAIAAAAEELKTTMAETLAEQGALHSDAEKMIRGELGKLIAAKAPA